MKGPSQRSPAKVREYLWRIADAYDRMACFPHAEAMLRELLDLELDREQRLEALCCLADIQVCLRRLNALRVCFNIHII